MIAPPMQPRLPSLLWPALGLAAILLGLAAGAGSPAHPPPGDAATHPLIALSLLHDRDLAWDERDLARAYRLWSAGPDGLALTPSPDGTLRYARPLAYPLAMLPFLLLGPSGPAVLNTLLLLAMASTALWLHDRARPGLPWPLFVFVAGSFLLSQTLVHTRRPDPTLLEAAGLFFPFAFALALDRLPHPLPPRRETVLGLAAGLLLGAAIVSSPPLAAFALAPAAALTLGRRRRALAGLVLGAVVAAGLLAAAEHRLAGRWSAWQPGVEHLTFRGAFPGDRATGPDAAVPAPPRPSPVRSAGRLASEAWWLLAGRHGGALPYFPFAVLAVVLALAAPIDLARGLLLAAALALAAWALLALPAPLAGGDPFAGHRWLAVLAPALALLPAPAAFGPREPGASGGRLAAWGAAAALLAAAAWTVPALAGSIVPAAPHLRLASFRALPVELSLLPRLPGYLLRSWGRGTWAFPAGDVYAAEGHPHGVWLRGGAEAELVLASPEPVESIAFTAFSPLPGNVLTVDAGGEAVIVRFDSPGKRAGVAVTMPAEPAARGLGFFPRAPGDAVYRVRVTTTEGWVPGRRDPGSADPRYLSTFLSFTGEPP